VLSYSGVKISLGKSAHFACLRISLAGYVKPNHVGISPTLEGTWIESRRTRTDPK
jgi:hypothetical protein